MDMFLMRLCALSGAIAGLALSQFRYLPNDER
jgi:hypothetical protein